MKKANLPIKWKLTIWYGGILALILVIFSCGVYIYFKNSLQKSIDTKIQSIGDVLSSSITETHTQSVFGNFERYLENVLGNHLAKYRARVGEGGVWFGDDAAYFRDEWGAVWNRSLDKDIGVVEDYLLQERSLAALTVGLYGLLKTVL